jgi:hypothetical protein
MNTINLKRVNCLIISLFLFIYKFTNIIYGDTGLVNDSTTTSFNTPINEPIEMKNVPDFIKMMLRNYTLIEQTFRGLGHIILIGLYHLISYVESGISQIIKFNSLDWLIQRYDLSSIYFLGFALLILSIIITASKLAIKGDSEIGRDLVKGIIGGVFIIILSITFIRLANNLYNTSVSSLSNNFKLNIGTKIFNENIYDLEASVKQKKIITIDMLGQDFLGLNWDSDSTGSPVKYSSYTKEKNKQTGKETITFKVQEWNKTPLIGDHVYQYQANFFSIIIIIVPLLVFYLVVGFKYMKNSFDLGVNFILLIIIGVSDTSEKLQKRKTMIVTQANLFFVNCYLVLSLILFKIFNDILSNYSATNHTNILFQALGVISLVYLFLDGSERIPQLFGIDAGFKSGLSALISTKVLASTVGKVIGRKGSSDGRIGGKGIIGGMQKMKNDVGSLKNSFQDNPGSKNSEKNSLSNLANKLGNKVRSFSNKDGLKNNNNKDLEPNKTPQRLRQKPSPFNGAYDKAYNNLPKNKNNSNRIRPRKV